MRAEELAGCDYCGELEGSPCHSKKERPGTWHAFRPRHVWKPPKETPLRGVKVPGRTKSFQLWLTADEIERLKTMAEEQGISAAGFLRQLIRRHSKDRPDAR
jgi:hypothetical protein